MSEMNCTSKTGKRKGAEEKNKHRTSESEKQKSGIKATEMAIKLC